MKKSALEYARELFNKFDTEGYCSSRLDHFQVTKEVIEAVLDELMTETNNIGYYLEVKRELNKVIEEKEKEGPGY